MLIGRFYARDVKVVKTNLTSETLKPSGIKRESKNEDDLTKENEIFFLKKRLGSIFRTQNTRVLHHMSIEFFLDSLKNMNIGEPFKCQSLQSECKFISIVRIDANSLSSKFTPLSSPRLL